MERIESLRKSLFYSEAVGRLFLIQKEDVYCYARKKINPLTGEVYEDVVANRPIFRKDEDVEVHKPDSKLKAGAKESEGESFERAAKRAKRRLFDLAYCNRFDLFVTLTLDKELVDRYDYKEIIKKLGVWLDHLVRRHGFAYIFVPERHKDGAIHFHGLVLDKGLKLAYSGCRDKRGRMVFNVVNWRYGFTTAVRLKGDYVKVARYVTKYIGKGMDRGTIGGRYFLHGGDLKGPIYEYYNASFEETKGKVVDVVDGGLKLCYLK